MVQAREEQTSRNPAFLKRCTCGGNISGSLRCFKCGHQADSRNIWNHQLIARYCREHPELSFLRIAEYIGASKTHVARIARRYNVHGKNICKERQERKLREAEAYLQEHPYVTLSQLAKMFHVDHEPLRLHLGIVKRDHLSAEVGERLFRRVIELEQRVARLEAAKMEVPNAAA